MDLDSAGRDTLLCDEIGFFWFFPGKPILFDVLNSDEDRVPSINMDGVAIR